MNLVSIAEYAQLHGVTADTVRQRILRGQHPEAVKIGRNWCIPKDAPYIDGRYNEAAED
jgi:hypothetical protein